MCPMCNGFLLKENLKFDQTFYQCSKDTNGGFHSYFLIYDEQFQVIVHEEFKSFYHDCIYQICMENYEAHLDGAVHIRCNILSKYVKGYKEKLIFNYVGQRLNCFDGLFTKRELEDKIETIKVFG